tara:strand:+ start:225 stop:437 length:213 start_codon:yes stop_codon:yes gene_type:complete
MVNPLEELEARQKRENNLAMNTPIALKVSKPFAANLWLKAIENNSNSSELARVLMEIGCRELGWDLDTPI